MTLIRHTNTICILKKHLLRSKYPKDFIDRILDRITHDLRLNYIPTLNPNPNLSPIIIGSSFQKIRSTSGLLPEKTHPILQLGESSPPRTLTPSIQGCPHYHQHHYHALLNVPARIAKLAQMLWEDASCVPRCPEHPTLFQNPLLAQMHLLFIASSALSATRCT